MGPPIPSAPLGHALGAKDARVTLGAYLDYVCPFSGKHYATLRNSVVPAYQGKSFKYVFYHQVQPWHPQSVQLHEAAIAVSKVAGEEGFWKYSDILFERAVEFYDVNVWDKTRPQIYEELTRIAADILEPKHVEAIQGLLSLQKIEGSKNPGTHVIQDIKWEVKASRQNGIHVSPTTTINGLIVDSSSSWGLPEWQQLLDPLLD